MSDLRARTKDLLEWWDDEASAYRDPSEEALDLLREWLARDTAIADLVARFNAEADEIHQDGDFCCAETRRNDALALYMLRQSLPSTPEPDRA